MNVTWHTKKDEGLVGERIVLQARKLGKPLLIAGSGRHRASQIFGSQNARAWVEIPRKTVTEKKDKDEKKGKT